MYLAQILSFIAIQLPIKIQWGLQFDNFCLIERALGRGWAAAPALMSALPVDGIKLQWRSLRIDYNIHEAGTA